MFQEKAQGGARGGDALAPPSDTAHRGHSGTFLPFDERSKTTL